MKATITEKPGIRVKQFAWDNQILYLHIKEAGIGKREYYIKDIPLESDKKFNSLYTSSDTTFTTGSATVTFNNQFTIPTPVGNVETVFSNVDISAQVKRNFESIDRNIEYLQNIKEILDYIQMLEVEYARL